MLKNRQGFTLIELMIVVAIISILAVIAQAAYSGYKRDALQKEATAGMFSIGADAQRLIYDWGLKSTGGGIDESKKYAPNPAIELDTTGEFNSSATNWKDLGISLDGIQRWCYQLCFYVDKTTKEENYAVLAIHPSSSGNDFGFLTSNMSKPVFEVTSAPLNTECGWSKTTACK